MSCHREALAPCPPGCSPAIEKLHAALHRRMAQGVRPGSLRMSRGTWQEVQAAAGIPPNRRSQGARAGDRLFGYQVTTVRDRRWRGLRGSIIIMPKKSAPPPGEGE